jgi:hypothetical protein
VIIKLINPNSYKDSIEDKLFLTRVNLSRIYISKLIRENSKKYVTTPKKYSYYVKGLDQWIVIAQKLNKSDIENTEEKLKTINQEPVQYLLFNEMKGVI